MTRFSIADFESFSSLTVQNLLQSESEKPQESVSFTYAAPARHADNSPECDVPVQLSKREDGVSKNVDDPSTKRHKDVCDPNSVRSEVVVK